MILNDKQIKKLVEEEEMINPFVDKSVSRGISISYLPWFILTVSTVAFKFITRIITLGTLPIELTICPLI